MAVIANVPYLHDPEVEWVYVIGRVKPGVSLPAVQSKISRCFASSLPRSRCSRSNATRSSSIARMLCSFPAVLESSNYRTTPSRNFIC